MSGVGNRSLLSEKLAFALVNGNLPWNQSTKVDVSAFLETHTLHDSQWIGLFVDCAFEDSIIAAIQFDPIWNSSVSTPSPRCADWPLLFLRFQGVDAVCLSGFMNVGGTQRGISDVVVQRLSEERCRTEIRDHYGAAVTLEHLSRIDVLALAPEGGVLELPKLRQ